MDSSGFFNRIRSQYQRALPFVVYRKPGQIETMALLQKNNLVYKIKDYSEKGFVFAPFDSTRESILIPIEHSIQLNVDYNVHHGSESVVSRLEACDDQRIAHIELVRHGINAISEGKLEKVVLSRCQTVPLKKSDPVEVLMKLLSTYPSAFVYCWYHPEIGLWLGATPETLIELNAKRIKTMALAGTQKYDGNLNATWGNKEQHEQKFVTEFLMDQLSGSVDKVTVSKTETIKAGELLHLRTTITGILNSSLDAILKKLHPTPAVCGLPQDLARSFILSRENYQREFYTGFLGELNLLQINRRNSNRKNVENNAYDFMKTGTHLFVNLRCMQIKNDQALIYVGGGITEDSIPEFAWEETVNKTSTIYRVLT